MNRQLSLELEVGTAVMLFRTPNVDAGLCDFMVQH